MAPPSWLWVDIDTVLAVHADLLAEYGGADGLRDRGGLEGALARPKNLAAYGEPDAAELAAIYAVGLAKAHAFVDANKRTAWTVANMFLLLNGWALAYVRIEAVQMMVDVADGRVDADAFANWIRRMMAPRGPR
jgi:death-on-curing protein